MSRLQTLSVVATFLAGIDSQFLSLSHSDPSMIVVTTVLSGAFVFHLATAIISFVASFVLVHYQITDIRTTLESSGVTSFLTSDPSDPRPLVPTQMVSVQRVSLLQKPKKTRDPVVEIFEADTAETKLGMPIALLTRCHNLCVFLCVLGFLLGIAGVMSYIWIVYTAVTGIFSSVCIAVSLVGAAVVFH